MSILLIDCSSKKIRFGFGNAENLLFEKCPGEDFNADSLTYFIKKELSGIHFDISSLEYVSLSNGPGSFTGLRIGSAIAKGICHAAGCSLIEIPTLDIIANKFKGSREVTALIYSNMRTGEFYYCRYRFDQLSHNGENAGIERIEDYGIASIEEIITLNEDSVLVSNDPVEINIPAARYKIQTGGNTSEMLSQFELSKKYIKLGSFSDYRISQPFYMKDFIPKV